MIRGIRFQHCPVGTIEYGWDTLSAPINSSAGASGDGVGTKSPSMSNVVSGAPSDLYTFSWYSVIASPNALYFLPSGASSPVLKRANGGTLSYLASSTTPTGAAFIHAVYMQNTGKIIGATLAWSYIITIDTGTDTTTYTPLTPRANLSVKKMLVLANNRLVAIGRDTGTGDYILIDIDPVTFAMTEHVLAPTVRTTDANSDETVTNTNGGTTIGGIAEHMDGYLYLGTDGGLAKIHPTNYTILWQPPAFFLVNDWGYGPLTVAANGLVVYFHTAAPNANTTRIRYIDPNSMQPIGPNSAMFPVEGEISFVLGSDTLPTGFSDAVLGTNGNVYGPPGGQTYNRVLEFNPYNLAYHVYTGTNMPSTTYIKQGAVSDVGDIYFATYKSFGIAKITGLPALPSTDWHVNRFINHT